MAFLLERAMLTPLLKAGMQSGTVMGSADAFVQNCIEEHEVYDPYRSLRWGCAGLLIHGPYFKLGMGKVDAFFGPATNFAQAAKKTAAAQFVLYPPFLCLLFAYMGVTEGLRSPNEIVDKVTKRVPEAFAGGCVFWPVANMVNFSFVSPAMRVPYLATAGCCFNSFLTWLNQRSLKATVETHAPQEVSVGFQRAVVNCEESKSE